MGGSVGLSTNGRRIFHKVPTSRGSTWKKLPGTNPNIWTFGYRQNTSESDCEVLDIVFVMSSLFLTHLRESEVPHVLPISISHPQENAKQCICLILNWNLQRIYETKENLFSLETFLYGFVVIATQAPINMY